MRAVSGRFASLAMLIGIAIGEVRGAGFSGDSASIPSGPIYASINEAPVALADCGTVVDDCVCDGWLLSADLVYWKPHLRALDYAVTEDGSMLVLGRAETHHVPLDREAGIRAAFGYRTKSAWEFSVGHLHYQTDGVTQVDRPAGIGQLFATRSHPDGAEESDTARAAAELEYDLFDLTAGRSIVTRKFLDFQLFGGLRWAQIDQRLRVDYDGRDFVEGVVIEGSDARGFGPRLGGRVDWRMAAGFGVFGTGSLSVLHGQFDTVRVETNLSGVERIIDVTDRYDQALLNLDSAVGVAWRNDRWAVRAGYELSQWFNAADRLLFVDDQHEANFAPISNDLLLEGFMLNVARTW